uniref:FERM domain-containing protein n=1 Tax=Parascaris univalens TaxID=6257 RepID=A0A915C9K4_PARUN
MHDSDGPKSVDGSSCCSRMSPTSLSEQGPSIASNGSVTHYRLPPFDGAHVQIIPSLHVSIPSAFKYLQIQTLTKETVTLAVHLKCRVRDAYLCCCAQLGINEDRLLGLAIRTPSEGIGADRPRHEFFFLDPDQKIAKYAPKQWRLSHAWNAVVESRPFLVLHLRVRIYVDKVQLIRCPTLLHHYYLQLRENLLDQWSGSNSVSEERCWEMAALALQVDHAADDHCSDQDFRAEQYFPLWVINLRGLDFVRRNMSVIRRDLRSCSQIDATLEYCHEASRSPFALNCHLYGLRRHKMDTVDNAIIDITPKGIDMSDVGSDGERIPLRSLRWGRMSKLCFDKRKLSITGMDGVCVSLYAQSEQKARYLLEFCRALHQAIIAINNHYFLNPYAYVSEVTSSFSCGDERSVDGPLCSRRSLVSHTSSNSTSGVVSDKPSSEPDKEGECSGVSRVASECSYEGSMRVNSLSDVVTEPERSSLGQRASTDRSTEIGTKSQRPQSASTASSAQHTSVRSVESSQNIVSIKESEGYSLPTTTLSNPDKTDMSSGSCSCVCYPIASGTKIFEEKRPSVQSDSSSPPALPHSLPPQLIPSSSTLHYSPLRMRDVEADDGASAANTATSQMITSSHPAALSGNVEIRQPPLYNEAVSLSQRTFLDEYAPIHRPKVNPHTKPRWTTVTGTGITYLDDYGRTTYAGDVSLSHCGLRCSVPQARSEPKLDQQVWSRPVSPLTSVSPPNVQPIIVASTRPTPSNTPPFMGCAQSAGIFQKQSRSGLRSAQPHNARGINRVQSMPAHNPHHFMQNSGDSGVSSSAVLHHAHSLAARPANVETKQPPPYEHAVLQARAQCVHRGAMKSTLGATVVDREMLHERHSYTTNSDDNMLLKSRIGQFPMMRALWQEQQQGITSGVAVSSPVTNSSRSSGLDRLSAGVDPCSSLSSVCASSLNADFLDSLLAPHLRRPSSCEDLSSPLMLTPPHSAPVHPTMVSGGMQPSIHDYRYMPSTYIRTPPPPPPVYRGEYYFDHSQLYRHYAPMQAASIAPNSWTPSQSVLDLPPPPPYPPPRTSPSPREAPMVM